MKRLLALTLLTTALSLPALAETSVSTDTGANLNVPGASVGAETNANVGASSSFENDQDANSNAAAAGGSSSAEQSTPSTNMNNSNSASSSNPANAQSSGQVVTGENLPHNDVKLIQQALRQEGLLSGTADGIWGPRTASALMQFQQQNQLGATGKLNDTTLDRLGVELSTDASSSSSGSGDVNSNNQSTIDNSEGVGSSSDPGSANTY